MWLGEEVCEVCVGGGKMSKVRGWVHGGKISKVCVRGGGKMSKVCGLINR